MQSLRLAQRYTIFRQFSTTPTTPIFSNASIQWLLGGLLPDHLQDSLQENSHSKTTRHDVLELNAGSGALSKAVLGIRPDLKLVGVDPAASMCAEYAKHVGPSADVLQGTSTTLPLLDSSVATAVVGASFVREGNVQMLAEIARVLVPGGGLGLIWSAGRDSSVPWVHDLETIVAPHREEKEESKGSESGDEREGEEDEEGKEVLPAWRAAFATKMNSNPLVSFDGDLLFSSLESKTLMSIEKMTEEELVRFVKFFYFYFYFFKFIFASDTVDLT